MYIAYVFTNKETTLVHHSPSIANTNELHYDGFDVIINFNLTHLLTDTIQKGQMTTTKT